MSRVNDKSGSAVGDYCPFDIVTDPAQFGLEHYVSAGQFGRINSYVSPRRSASVTLLLHGVGGSWSAWTPLLQEARAQGVALGDLALVDLPGFGQSENTTGELAVDDVAEDLVRLIQRRGWQGVRVLGHSMGGFLALHMASRRDLPIERVATVCGAYFGIVEAAQNPLHALRTEPGTAVAYLGLRAIAGLGSLGSALLEGANRLDLLERGLNGLVAHPDQLKPGVRAGLVSGTRPRSFVLAAKNAKGYDAEAQWGQIESPTVALFGESDRLVPPAEGERLTEILPEVVCTTIPDSAHLPHIEQPRLTLQALRGLFDR